MLNKTASEQYATDAISQSAQDCIKETIQNDLDFMNYNISSIIDDMFAMMLHLYYNEPELFEKNMEVWEKTKEKVVSFDERLTDATSIVDIKNKFRQRRGLLVKLVGGAL